MFSFLTKIEKNENAKVQKYNYVLYKKEKKLKKKKKICSYKKISYLCGIKKIKNLYLSNLLLVVYVKSLRDRFHLNSRFV